MIDNSMKQEMVTISKKEYEELKKKAEMVDPEFAKILRLRKRALEFDKDLANGKVYTREEVGI